MQRLLIVAGPSEEPLRVTVLADQDAMESDQSGRHIVIRPRVERAIRRASRPRQALRWARRARAILVGLKERLVTLIPPNRQADRTHQIDAARRSSSLTPRLRLVRDCGRALAIACASQPDCGLAMHDAITPRHRLVLRSVRARRQRWRWR